MKKFNVNKSNSLTTCFLLIISFFLIGEVRAATHYVAPNGNDSNSGSISAPFKTIQKAADIVNPGDTVYVRAGIYNAKVVLRRSGSSGAYITFQNYPGETAILDGTGLGNGVMIQGIGISYVKIIGFKIRNHIGAGIQIQPGVSNGFNGSHLEIRDNEIYNQSYESIIGHAILVTTFPWESTNAYSDIIIDGNYVHDVVTGADHAYNETITLAGQITRFQITNNLIDNTRYIGIDMIGKGAKFPSHGIVKNNEVRNSLKLSECSGIYVDGGKNILIENNKIYNNGGNGIVVSTEEATFVTENVIVRRNLVWNNVRNILIGSTWDGTSRHNRFVHNTAVLTSGNHTTYAYYKSEYNIVKNNISYITGALGAYHVTNWYGTITNTQSNYNNYYLPNLYYQYAGNFYTSLTAFKNGTAQDANSIGVDPRFVNVAIRDFSLQSDSPCIDAGDFLTRTTSAGSGTVIPVADARYFHDGYGIAGVSGDTIRIGNNTVRVTAVNYSANTITVTPSISWNKGDGVSYPYSGAAPDIGAYEYTGAGDTTPPAAPTGLIVK